MQALLSIRSEQKCIPAILRHQARASMENRSGLVVGAVVTHADGYGEQAAAKTMIGLPPGCGPKTL